MNHLAGPARRFTQGGLIPLILLLLLAGCGDRQPRYAVEGKVLLDGEPLPTGTITFLPADQTAAPSAGGAIVDGEFRIPKHAGPQAGSYRVRIVAQHKTGRQVYDPQFGSVEEVVALRFEVAGSLTAEVGPVQENIFEFSLRATQ